MPESFRDDFRRFFTRGLAAMLPTLLSITILIYVFTWVHKYVGIYINIGLYFLIEQSWRVIGAPSEDAVGRFKDAWFNSYWWVGFVLAFVAVYIFGKFVTSFVGRAVWRTLEMAFLKLPLIRQVYPYVKQVTDFILSDRQTIEFSQVVAVEYPRKGIWSLGLATGQGMRDISRALDSETMTIFIPSSPTPVTGYTITVRRDEVIELPINIEDAFRFTISGGVIIPLNQKLTEAEIQQLRLDRARGSDKRKETPE